MWRRTIYFDRSSIPAIAEPEGDVDEREQHRHLEQRPDDGGKRHAGVDPEDPDGDRDGELEVVARGGERKRR